MLIHQLSRRTGITIHTIRFYEKSGLLKGKRNEFVKSNTYNHYDEESIERLELIRDAKSIGFTINEISQLIDAWYSNKTSTTDKLCVLDEKLIEIENGIKQLRGNEKTDCTVQRRYNQRCLLVALPFHLYHTYFLI
ncbi:MAG: MerR family transcriptional regulator [Bacteroidota bacterium]|jgi:MerR family copper efflux transcriptional regulator